MAKLTLSVDTRVVARAKRFAKLQGVSVSEIVETYLSAIAEPPSPTAGATPILHSLRGVLKGSDVHAYRKHLAAKYR
jgi:hypothetical protein